MPASGYPAGTGGGSNYPSERDYDPTPRRPFYRNHRQNPSYNPPFYQHSRALSEENNTSLSQLHSFRSDQDLTTDLLTSSGGEDSGDPFFSMKSPTNLNLSGNWSQLQPHYEGNEEPHHTRHQSLLFSQRHAPHGSISKHSLRSKHDHQPIGVSRMNRPQRAYQNYEREPPLPKIPLSSLESARESRMQGMTIGFNGQQQTKTKATGSTGQHGQTRVVGSPGPIIWNTVTDDDSTKASPMYHQPTQTNEPFPQGPSSVPDPYPNRFEIGLGIGMSPPRSYRSIPSIDSNEHGRHYKPLATQSTTHQAGSSIIASGAIHQPPNNKISVDTSSTTQEFGVPASNQSNMWAPNTFGNDALSQETNFQGNGIASSSRSQITSTFPFYDPMMRPNMHTNYENLASHVQLSETPSSWGFNQPVSEARSVYVPYSEVHRRQEQGRLNQVYEKHKGSELTQGSNMTAEIPAGSSSTWYPRNDSWNTQDMHTGYRELSPDSAKSLKADVPSTLDELLFPPSRLDYEDALESQRRTKPPSDRLAIERAFCSEQDLSMDVPGPDYDEEAKMLEWSEDAVEEMMNLLEAAERYKWKYVSEELSQRQNKRIPSRACKNKFSSMFGETECSSLLRSSLFYVAYRSGWQTIRNLRTASERQTEQDDVKHESSDATLAKSTPGENSVKIDNVLQESSSALKQ